MVCNYKISHYREKGLLWWIYAIFCCYCTSIYNTHWISYIILYMNTWIHFTWNCICYSSYIVHMQLQFDSSQWHWQPLPSFVWHKPPLFWANLVLQNTLQYILQYFNLCLQEHVKFLLHLYHLIHKIHVIFQYAPK